MSEERQFPLQEDRRPVPWSWAEEAYREYAFCYGTSQTLERIAERGGFGAVEMIHLLVSRIKRMEATKG